MWLWYYMGDGKEWNKVKKRGHKWPQKSTILKGCTPTFRIDYNFWTIWVTIDADILLPSTFKNKKYYMQCENVYPYLSLISTSSSSKTVFLIYICPSISRFCTPNETSLIWFWFIYQFEILYSFHLFTKSVRQKVNLRLPPYL